MATVKSEGLFKNQNKKTNGQNLKNLNMVHFE